MLLLRQQEGSTGKTTPVTMTVNQVLNSKMAAVLPPFHPHPPPKNRKKIQQASKLSGAKKKVVLTRDVLIPFFLIPILCVLTNTKYQLPVH